MKELDRKDAPEVSGGQVTDPFPEPIVISDPIIVAPGPTPTVPPYVPTKSTEY